MSIKAYREIGMRKSARYLFFTVFYLIYRALPFPQLRSFFLRLLGAKIGKNCIIHNARFMNYYRAGFSGLTLGDDCFIGDECLLDLAAPITLHEQVTLAERVTIITHLNVGYRDHPLQQKFPTWHEPVEIGRGSFVGTSATVLGGVTIGEESFVAAASLVKDPVPARQLVGGVPAKTIREL